MAKNTLPLLIKRFIVFRLAIRMTPSQISERVKKVFDIDITRQGVNAYNPLKKAGKNLSPELTFLFDSVRDLHDFEQSRKKETETKTKTKTVIYKYP